MAGTPHTFEDLVEYSNSGSTSRKTIKGLDSVVDVASTKPTRFHWRGSSLLLKLVTSDWQLLGFGATEDGNQWVVTFFMPTLFTPAGELKKLGSIKKGCLWRTRGQFENGIGVSTIIEESDDHGRRTDPSCPSQ